jgi:hypothetical protein
VFKPSSDVLTLGGACSKVEHTPAGVPGLPVLPSDPRTKSRGDAFYPSTR